MRSRAALTLTALLLMPAAPALGHGLVVQASTPITPPLDLLWVLPAFGVGLLACNLAVQMTRYSMPLVQATLMSLGLLVAVFVSHFMMVAFGSNLLGAAFPMAFFPERALWGVGGGRGWALFTIANGVELALLAGCSMLMGRVVHGCVRSALPLAALNSGLYLLFLLPFAMTGALLHGSGGAYVFRDCQARQWYLSEALKGFTEDHGGLMPVGRDSDGVMVELRPYCRQGIRARYLPLEICPLGEARDRNPEPYTWNRDLSGRSWSSVVSAPDSKAHPPFACKYHAEEGWPNPEYWEEFLERDSASKEGK